MKKIVFIFLVVFTLSVSVIVGDDVINSHNITDHEIAISAPMDLLGLGFWITWGVTTIIVSVSLAISFRLSESLWMKKVVFICGVIYLFMSFIWYSGFSELEARVLG